MACRIGIGQRRSEPAGNRTPGACRFAGSTVAVPGSEVDALAPGLDPGLEVLDAIDHTSAELRVARACAIDAVLLEGPNGQPDETGGLGVRR